MRRKKQDSMKAKRFRRGKSNSLLSPKRMLISENSEFHIVEAFKNLRTNTLYALAAKNQKAMIITSPSPNDGKTTICSNLAISLSQLGAKVIIVDADMRKPTQHKCFEVINDTGLASILAGFSAFENAVKCLSDNLDLLASGPLPPNPSELLGSDNMKKLLAQLKELYDYIIIDTPPVNIVSDALIIMNKEIGVILSTYHKKTLYRDVQKAIEKIEMTDSQLLGGVVTGVNRSRKSYGYYKNYKYEEDL